MKKPAIHFGRKEELCTSILECYYLHIKILVFHPVLPQVTSDSDTVWQQRLLDATVACQLAVANQALSPCWQITKLKVRTVMERCP